VRVYYSEIVVLVVDGFHRGFMEKWDNGCASSTVLNSADDRSCASY
jgi:hypothetical protein